MILGLDCSGETYSVGLWDKELALNVSGFRPRSALLELPQGISYLLKTANRSANDIDAVGVTAGPGSFTGVRLGVTVAKTIALVSGCPILAWDTLELLAQQALPSGSLGTAAVAIDARKGELYCAIFRRNNLEDKLLETILDTNVSSPEGFRKHLSRLDSFHLALGSGFLAYKELLGPYWPGPRLCDRLNSAPSGLAVASLSALFPERYRPAAEVFPLYYRQADIQVSTPCSPG